jgi:hypothetical protein
MKFYKYFKLASYLTMLEYLLNTDHRILLNYLKNKIKKFLDMTQCLLVLCCRSFGGKCCFQLRKIRGFLQLLLL